MYVMQACQRWLSDLREDDLSVVVTGRLPSAKCPVTIISYDLASRLGTELAQRKPDAIIVVSALPYSVKILWCKIFMDSISVKVSQKQFSWIFQERYCKWS